LDPPALEKGHIAKDFSQRVEQRRSSSFPDGVRCVDLGIATLPMVFNLSAELFQIMSECEAVGLQECAAQGGLRGGLLGVKGLQLPVEGRDAEEKICQLLGELRPSVPDRAAWALQLQDAFKPFDRVAQQ
jgi:hypothetical protein